MISLGESWASRKKTETLSQIVNSVNSVSRNSILEMLVKYDLQKRGAYTLQA